jgi:phospholipid transport system substrate-binding protein
MVSFQKSRKTIGIGILFLLCSFIVKADEWKEASLVIEKSTKAMVDLFEESRLESIRLSLSEDTVITFDDSQMLLSMEVILDPVIDFNAIAKGVMGKFYRRASPKQVKDFQVSFRESLLNTYSRVMISFKVNDFEVQSNSTNSKAGRQKIWLKVYANGAAYDINYSMKKNQKGWMVTNVTLDGINLGVAFRKQFSSSMARNRGSMDDVIEFWNDPS